MTRHRWNLILGLMAAGLGYAVVAWDLKRPPPPRPLDPPLLEAPVPMQEWTADAGAALPLTLGLATGSVPALAPGQKPAASCDAELAEVPINGGCWMKTDVPPPCPERKLWEHEGACWRPIPRTAKAPTSGEPRSGNVAGPRR